MVLGVTCIVTAAWAAQTPDISALRAKLAENMKANQAALRQYTWKQRTELAVKGETKSVKLAQCSYDTAGQLQKVSLDTPAQGGQETRRGLRGRIVEKKKEEMTDYIQRMMTLVQQYFSASSGRVQEAMQRGDGSIAKGQAPGTAEAAFKNVVVNGDSMTMVFNTASHMPESLHITSMLDSDPIQVTGTFGSLPGGPNYLSIMDAQSPQKQIAVKISNYDYHRAGSGM